MDLKRKASELVRQLSEAEVKVYIGQLQTELEQRKKKKKKIDTSVQPTEEDKIRFKALLLKLRNGSEKERATEKEREDFVTLVRRYGSALSAKKMILFRKTEYTCTDGIALTFLKLVYEQPYITED